MKHAVTAVMASVILTGCATSNTLIDGLLGRYHNYDAIEYAQTVNLVMNARTLEAACAEPDLYQYRLSNINNGARELRTYAEGRPYNSRTVELTDRLAKLVADTANKDGMSAFFCRERSKNIVKATEILRASSGEKPE